MDIWGKDTFTITERARQLTAGIFDWATRANQKEPVPGRPREGGLKLALCGPSKCGKDEVARWLHRNTSLRYTMATSEVIAPVAAERLGISVEVAFATRHRHRDLWRAIGDELRVNDPAYLARRVLADGDLLVGVRSLGEITTAQREGMVDLTVWIDRPGVEKDTTLEFGPEVADMILPNWWGVRELHARVRVHARAWGVLRGYSFKGAVG
jgi:hypothetical protein